jgi:nucleoside-diphosphate-sugar epimerase
MLLVTGGLGFLGRRLVAHILASTDARVRLLVRPGAQGTALAQDHPDAHRIELFPASFNRVEDLKAALKDIDVVYHLAASLRGSYAAQVANTVVGTENLFLAVLEAEVTRVVLVSSFLVMGVIQTSVVDESVPLESRPQWREPNGFAKLRQEELAWRYIREHRLPIVIVRPGVIYGPGTPILTPRIGLRLFGMFLHLGGSNEIPLTHVENCAEAVLRAGQVADIDGEVFNICDDGLPTAKKILKQYRRVVQKIPYLTIPYFLLRLIGKLNELYTARTQGHLPLVFRPYLVESMWKSRKYSNRKAKQVLGWTPRIPIEEGLRSTLEHILASHDTRPTPTPDRGHPTQSETSPVAVGGELVSKNTARPIHYICSSNGAYCRYAP